MQTIYDLPTPALLVDADTLERNLRAMAERCQSLGVRLRPHVKTHKCVEIALAQRQLGAAGITVSTLAEARVFAEHGFEDVTWAYPLVPSRTRELEEIGSRTRLGVVVDSEAAAAAVSTVDAPLRVWLKVDCGYGRAGVDPRSAAPRRLADAVLDGGLELAGLLSHSGNAYRAGSRTEMARIAEAERATMVRLASDLKSDGIEIADISVGSTPSMSACRDLSGVTEVRPGNYALYDYTQVVLGACSLSHCAATVLASVVSSSAARGTSVVDAGALAMSLDTGSKLLNRQSYGEVLSDRDPGLLRRNARLTSLSQEHGILSVALPVGSRVRIVPNHSCLTVACFDRASVVRSDVVLDTWAIHRGR